MKTVRLISVFAFLSLATMGTAVYAEEGVGYKIYGDVSLDGAAPELFEVSVTNYSRSIVEIAANVFLEITAPTDVDTQVTSIQIVRVLAGERKVLKSINSTGYTERSWSFALCGEEIATASPASAVSCNFDPNLNESEKI